MEYLEYITPALIAIVSGSIGFFANYFIDSKNHKRLIDQQQHDHLKEIYHEYTVAINELFTIPEIIFTSLKEIHNKKLTKEIVKDLDIKDKEALEKFTNLSLTLQNVLVKFDFLIVIEIEEEFEHFESYFNHLKWLLEQIAVKNKKVPIGDEELKVLEETEKNLEVVTQAIRTKLSEFYSKRYLPKTDKIIALSNE